MGNSTTVVTFLLLTFLLASKCTASEGDRQPFYKECTENCERSGCIGSVCLSNCEHTRNDASEGDKQQLRLISAFLVPFEGWDCGSECRYQCMMEAEEIRSALGEPPLKYHGKWPFTRLLTLQEPASVFFSLLNLLVHLHGVLSFHSLVHHKLPQRVLQVGGKSPYYAFCGIWELYGLLSINSWLWSAIFHSRDTPVTEKLDYSSAIALLGFTLLLTIIRTGNLRVEAAQVMVAAPIIAFVTTHIMYLNFYKFDYGLNMKVCVALGAAQLILWTGWAGLTRHPERFNLLFVVIGTAMAMLLEVFDFSPMWGVVDAHALWHAATVPLTVMWWKFIRDDAKWSTHISLDRTETPADADSRKDK